MEFFFDFMSPYAYLSLSRIRCIADQHKMVLQCRPFDLPTGKLAAGNYGPANRMQPAKIRHLLVDLERWADLYQLPLKFPPSLDSRRANMGVFFAGDPHEAADYVTRAYDLSWGQGGDMSLDSSLCQLAAEMGWFESEFLDFVNSDQAWQQLKANQREALERGIFGAPTFLIDDQMWWGNDRLQFVERYLEASAAD